MEIKHDLLLKQCAWPCLWAAISSGCELLQRAQVRRTHSNKHLCGTSETKQKQRALLTRLHSWWEINQIIKPRLKRTQLCISPQVPSHPRASCCRTDPNMLSGLITLCDSRITPRRTVRCTRRCVLTPLK